MIVLIKMSLSFLCYFIDEFQMFSFQYSNVVRSFGYCRIPGTKAFIYIEQGPWTTMVIILCSSGPKSKDLGTAVLILSFLPN